MHPASTPSRISFTDLVGSVVLDLLCELIWILSTEAIWTVQATEELLSLSEVSGCFWLLLGIVLVAFGDIGCDVRHTVTSY